VIIQVLQGYARACKSRISKRFSFLCLAQCCTVLRSRWCQSDVKTTAVPAVLERRVARLPYPRRLPGGANVHPHDGGQQRSALLVYRQLRGCRGAHTDPQYLPRRDAPSSNARRVAVARPDHHVSGFCSARPGRGWRVSSSTPSKTTGVPLRSKIPTLTRPSRYLYPAGMNLRPWIRASFQPSPGYTQTFRPVPSRCVSQASSNRAIGIRCVTIDFQSMRPEASRASERSIVNGLV
jgi:hypothetical protein